MHGPGSARPGEVVIAAQITAADVDALVGWSLLRAAHRVERDLTAVLAGVDLSPVQFGVLATLATRPPCTQAELARTVLVRPQSMAGVVSTMVARDLVARSGPGGRGVATTLVLTERGREALERAWPRVVGAHGPARLGLDAERTTRTVAALHHLASAPGSQDRTAEQAGRAP